MILYNDYSFITVRPMHFPTTAVDLIIFLVVGISGGRPPECSWSLDTVGVTAGSGEGLKANCQLRTLVPEVLRPSSGNTSMAAVQQASQITTLVVNCSQRVVFESEIVPSMFSIFPRLETLVIVTCKVTELPDSAFLGVPHLRFLTLHSHHEDWPGASLVLQKGVFSELFRLEHLDLAFNHLWSLPSSSLCKLPSLVQLNLTYNFIHHLTDLGIGDQCSLPLLRLDLSYNQLNEINAAALIRLADLQELLINDNGIVHLSDTAFTGLSELRRLDISNNQLVALPQSVFSELHQLQELKVSNNSIRVLAPGLFSSLSQLHTLDLSFNQLVFGSNRMELFHGLIRLLVLDISHNAIASLPSEAFSTLYSLQVLSLCHNQLSSIDNFAFSGLSNLHTLRLSHNKLTALSGKTLQGLSVLSFLHLDHNSILSIDEMAFRDCSSLVHLNLSRNEFTSLPSSVKGAVLLRSLDLSYNNIVSVKEGSLRGLNHLSEFNLSHNAISNITRAAVADVSTVTNLDLSYNNLQSLDYGIFDSVQLLKSLNLVHNHLNSIYGIAITLQHLQWLNVSYNQIHFFDYAGIPKNVKVLDISHNLLQELKNQYRVENEIELAVLYASFNNLTEINGVIIPKKIEKIYLSNNAISYVASNTFFEKRNIRVIDLRDNCLSFLDESSLRLAPTGDARQAFQPDLLLAGNPLNCDCSLDWLSSSVVGAGFGMLQLPQLTDIASVKCTLPGIWDGAIVPLITVQPQQFLCTYRRHCFTVCHCCDFDACDCEQTCPRNCTCYHDSTWTHNIVDCSKGGWENMPSGVPMDVTEAFIDGNNMSVLSSHALIGRKNLRVMYLNDSHITVIQNRTFNGLKSLQVLRLDHNDIAILQGYEFIHLHNLLELHLNYNRLTYIANITFTPLRSLEILKLDNNLLVAFPVWNLALNPFLVEVSLEVNRWSCECKYVINLRAWLETNRIKTINATLITCFHNSTGQIGPSILSDAPVHCDHYVASNKMSVIILKDYILIICISTVFLILLLCGFLTIFIFRKRLKLWAISGYGKHFFYKSSYSDEPDKLFDAFVSHSSRDVAWVCGVLAPELEARGYHLCVTYRDCISPSVPLSSQAVIESIDCSRRILIVITRNFVETEWCKYEFKSSHMEAITRIQDKRRIVILFLEDVPSSEFDSELAALVKTAKVALCPRDPTFWERLRRALPALRHRRKTAAAANECLKAVSSPLILTEHQNGATWQTTTLSDNKSLKANPFWETAVISNMPETDISEARWIYTDPFVKSSLTCASAIPKDDHTYVSVSECGDSCEKKQSMTNDDLPVSSCANFSVKNNGVLPSSRSHSVHHFRPDAPDYLTSSWVFHPPPKLQPPPPPGQTYFV